MGGMRKSAFAAKDNSRYVILFLRAVCKSSLKWSKKTIIYI